MKTFIAVLVAAVVGFTGAYYVVTQKSQASLAAAQAEAAARNQEIQRLQTAVTNANIVLGRTVMAAPPYAVSPDVILKRLSLIDPTSPESRTRKIREIIHQLEALVDAGTNSFYPIRQFIASGADVDYNVDDAKSAGPVSFWSWRPGAELRSGLVLPPTLRISLVDVMRYIGTEDAEISLAWMLTAHARGMEIPYIAQALEKMAPGHYTALALQAATNYLASAGTNSASARRGDGYIYDWLGSLGDTSLVAMARQSLTNSDGKLDVEAARYMVNATKGGALTDLASVYSSGDPDTKNKLLNVAFDYVGASPAANSMFQDWIQGNDVSGAPGSISARPREVFIRLLAGGKYGPFSAPVPTDPAVIQGRLDMLHQMQFNSPRLQQASTETSSSLQGLLGSH